MKTILLICLFPLFILENNKIIIDVAKADKVNISEIAEKVWVVPLATGDEVVDIFKVFMIDNLIYVLEGNEKDKYAHRVLKFDIKGMYLGLFGISDPMTGEYIMTTDMQYDRTTGLIYLNNLDGYRVYDKNGNLKDFMPNAQAKFIFNKYFWFNLISVNDGVGNISLVKKDFKSQKSDTIENFKFEMPEIFNSKGVGVFPPMGLSTRKDELFVSLGTDNTIYKEHNNKLVPAYKFGYINGVPTFFDMVRAPKKLLIGHFIKYGYGINGLSYDFLYDTRSGVSYNIRYAHDNLNRLVSGIKDDINLTGYFRINPTNQENYIYFFKRHEDIKGSKLYDPNQINHLLFLVKLK